MGFLDVEQVLNVVIGIPTLNRYDLLARAVTSALNGTLKPDRIVIIDNGGKFASEYRGPKQLVEVVSPGKNTGCAGGWNLIIRAAKADDAVCILNDDLEMRRNGIEKLVTSLRESKAPQTVVLGGPKPMNGWSAFALFPKLTDFAGFFDEGFWPAYYEDMDYRRRLNLLGVTVIETEACGNHENQGTLKALGVDKEALQTAFNRCENRYIQKWGGLPGGETLLVPSNIESTQAE